VFGAALEDILGGRCPFLALQKFRLALIERAAKWRPKSSGAVARRADARACTVETRIVIDHIARNAA